MRRRFILVGLIGLWIALPLSLEIHGRFVVLGRVLIPLMLLWITIAIVALAKPQLHVGAVFVTLSITLAGFALGALLSPALALDASGDPDQAFPDALIGMADLFRSYVWGLAGAIVSEFLSLYLYLLRLRPAQ